MSTFVYYVKCRVEIEAESLQEAEEHFDENESDNLNMWIENLFVTKDGVLVPEAEVDAAHANLERFKEEAE